MNTDFHVPQNTKETVHLVNRVWLLAILLLFLVCILIPTYMSGIHRLSNEEILRKHIDLVFYSGEFGQTPQFFGMLFTAGISYLLPVALLIMALILVSPSVDPITSRRKIQLFIIAGTLTVIAVTWPASQAFITWVAD